MSESGSEQSDRVIPEADCPGCDDGTVLEVPEAGYATCGDCGERGYRRGDSVEWWRNDPDSQWYVEDDDSGVMTDGGVDQSGVDHRELRQEARELREQARNKVAVALALEDGELTQHEAEQYLQLDDDLAMVQSDHYPGDNYYDRADRCLERRGDMDV